jgi:hypothetical protein
MLAQGYDYEPTGKAFRRGYRLRVVVDVTARKCSRDRHLDLSLSCAVHKVASSGHKQRTRCRASAAAKI